MEPLFLAEIIGFAGNFAPRGWALCDGQLLPINNYQSLYSLLGTSFGGDGRTSFALPDLRGRSIVHPGTGPGLSTIRLGQRGGAEYVVLNSMNLPSHNHTALLHADTAAGNKLDPTNRLLGGAAIYTDSVPATNIAMNAESIVVGHTGGSQPVYTRSPYQAINYIIALQGNYPSRN